MNEVILETMKENGDKFWYVQNQIDTLSEIVHKLEERTDEALVLLGERIQKIEGPPIPKPNPKHYIDVSGTGKDPDESKVPTDDPLVIYRPGRVELREMLISICKEVYKYWPRTTDEMDRYDVFRSYMEAKGYDYKKDIRPELWAQERVKKFKNHELQEALRILGVME